MLKYLSAYKTCLNCHYLEYSILLCCIKIIMLLSYLFQWLIFISVWLSTCGWLGRAFIINTPPPLKKKILVYQKIVSVIFAYENSYWIVLKENTDIVNIFKRPNSDCSILGTYDLLIWWLTALPSASGRVRNIFLCNNTLKIVDQFAFQTSTYQSGNAWGEPRHAGNFLGANLAADRLGGSVQVCIPFIFHILVIKLPHYFFFC